MAVARVNVKEQYGSGEIWSDAENETAAVQEVQEWLDAHPPWEFQSLEPVRGDDGHYKFTITRSYAEGAKGAA